MEWTVVGSIIAAVAFVLRVGVHAGRESGGVDTWYYLAYADAVRHRPGFDVGLPQYLLQDERQSAPPLFPMLLALLPQPWLRRWSWTISPVIDCLHLLPRIGRSAKCVVRWNRQGRGPTQRSS